MINTIFFDLDGTSLHMNQDVFLKDYFSRLAAKMKDYGYDPDHLLKSIRACTEAMVRNSGSTTNEELFWNSFSEIYGRDLRRDEPIFVEFYQNEFQKVRLSCGLDQRASDCVHQLKQLGYRLILATNPLFPAVATKSRIQWAGLNPDDFEWVTTYENASYCKPNPDYYKEILEKMNLKPENCMMVGNDVEEDMIAAALGMRVFLLTDCLINKFKKDITAYPHGSFPELMKYIRSTCVC